MRRSALLCLALAACTEHGSGGATFVGECEPALGSVDLGAEAVVVGVGCFDSRSFDSEVDVVETLGQWDQLLGDTICAAPPPADFANARIALVHLRCSPIDFRFGAEGASDVVVGVMQGVSGDCITTTLAVPLPRSDKPVRVAKCQVEL